MVAGRAIFASVKHMVTQGHSEAVVFGAVAGKGDGGEGRWLKRRRVRRSLAFAGGAGALLLALAPRSAAEGERTLGLAEAELPVCRPTRACPDPGPTGWGARLEVILEDRAPAIPEIVRRRIARAVVEESLGAGIDPLLAAAIIDVESGFDPAAQSRRGARGLMQLRPSTMAREAARHGIAAGDPGDPVANVRLGIRYYRRLLDAFGREDRALMAYNAGPNRIGRLAAEGRVPSRFRGYPARVLAEQRRLRMRFGLAEVPTLAQADILPMPARE